MKTAQTKYLICKYAMWDKIVKICCHYEALRACRNVEEIKFLTCNSLYHCNDWSICLGRIHDSMRPKTDCVALWWAAQLRHVDRGTGGRGSGNWIKVFVTSGENYRNMRLIHPWITDHIHSTLSLGYCFLSLQQGTGGDGVAGCLVFQINLNSINKMIF